MFELHAEVVYALFVILLLANVINFGCGQFFIRGFARIAQMQNSILMPIILMLCILGTYATRGNPFDVLILLLLGLIGFFLSVVEIPSAPLVIAYLVAPMAEENLRRALIIARGDWTSALLGSPLALGVIASVILLAFIIVRFMQKRFKATIMP